MDVDLKQQLIYLLMSIKEIGASVNGLERKIDGTSDSIGSMEQQLLQMKQQQIFAKMEKGLSLVDVDTLLKKHISQTSFAPGQKIANGNQSPQQQPGISDQQTASLGRLEQGMNDLLEKNQLAALPSTEGKAGAVDHVGNSVRQEIGSFQASLMTEIKAQHQAAEKFQSQCLEQLGVLMQEFSGGKSRLPPIPFSGTNGQNLDSNGIGMQPGSDAGVLPIVPEKDGIDKETGFLEPVDDAGIGLPDLEAGGPATQVVEVDAQKDPTANDEDEEEDSHPRIYLQESSSLAAVFSNDEDLQVPPYHVEEAYYKTGYNQAIARSDRFANFTVLVVMFNAVYIGFDSDYNNASNIYKADIPFQVCSQFFCVYFTWELVVRFLAFEIKHACLKDGWFKFDAFLVSTMILDTWVLMPILYMLGGGVQIPTQPLRMLRLFKLTRMARLMKALPELVTQIKGLMRSLRAISSSMILVGLMVYVWAIMMHMLMKEEKEYNDKLWEDSSLGFTTMTRCIWTLLMAGTMMLDDSSPLMSSLLFSDKFNYVLAGFLFVAYTLISAMCILQMLIGVLCDVVSTVKAEEQSANAIGLLKQELVETLTACDDGDGKISQQELHTIINAAKSKSLLKRLKINHAFLVELLRGLYKKPGMQVPIQDILELMVQCRGENVSTVETMSGALVRIINEINTSRTKLELDLGSLETRMAQQIRASHH